MAMARKSLAARLRSQVRHFATAREGNIAVIFALASLPIVGLIGAAVDYSRANAIKADLQSSLDATALMISKSAATQSADELQTSAQAYFDAVFKHPEAKSTKITASYKTDGGSAVTVDGSTIIKTEFTQVMGFSEVHVLSSSTVAWGTSKLQVALVLDNTGSMSSSGKIGALKAASRNLLKQLEAAAQKDGDVRVSIIPFANGVNVGKDNKDATWLDWSYFSNSGGSGWDSGGGSSSGWSSGSSGSGSSGSSSSGSGSSGSGSSWSGSGGSYSGGGSSTGNCSWSNCWSSSNSSWSSNSGSTDKSRWQGCVMDRDQDYDVQNTTPATSNKPTLFPTVYSTSCPVTLMPLSYDWAALRQKVDSMSPQGTTNQTIGLAWGWQALSQGVPLSAPVADKDTKRIIILFTDGLNTENRWTTDASKIDARTEKACANVKAAGITLYTVQVKGNGDPTSAILQKCATDSKKFFALDSAEQIVTAFNTIGTNLSQLRLAK